MRLIRGTALVAVPWRNGHGLSRELHAQRAPDGALLWQASLADLERDAPFSAYPGIDRVFVPLGGAVALAIAGDAFHPCRALVPVAFAGEAATRARVAAPGRALNLFAARAHRRIAAEILGLDPGACAGVARAALLYVAAGVVALGPDRLEAGDAALGADEVRACGPATLILARVTPAPAAWPPAAAPVHSPGCRSRR